MILSTEGYSELINQCKDCCSETAVHTAIANFNYYGSYKDLNKSGRPMKTSPKMI